MIETLSLDEAQSLFVRLPAQDQLATLSPNYVTVDAMRDEEVESLFLAYREGGNFWMHSVHHGRVAGTHWFDLQSPYGYGGPVTNSDNPAFLDRAWTSYCQWCQTHDILAEFVRFHPLVKNTRYYGGVVQDDRTTVAVPLSFDGNKVKYATRVKRGIAKATNADVKASWQSKSQISKIFGSFYREGMVALGASDFYLFSNDYFEALSHLPGARFLVCGAQGENLSMGIFLYGEKTIEYHLGATTSRGRDLRSAFAMFDTVVKHGCETGKEWFYLGGGTDGRDDNSLLFFKAGFAEERFPFCIGYKIHQPEAYGRLKASYQQQFGTTSRILFYR